MYSTSAAFAAAVRGSHTVAIQVDAYSSGTLIASNIQVESGSVTVSAASGVRRQLSLTVSDVSVSPFGSSPISPYGVELHVSRGITLLNGTTELIPLGVFRVESMTSPRQGEVVIVAPDRSAKIIDAKFLIPTMSNTGLGLAAQISALVTDVYPSGVSVTNVDVPATSVPWLLWDQERWDAIQKLATAVGAVVFFDVAGNVVLRLAPTISDAVAWYVNSGAQGVMIDASREITRAETYNVVVAVGERSDGVVPARAVSQDNDTTSATYVGGPFGYVPFFFSSPLITTSGGATTVADALLARKRSLGRECTLSCVPNPALDVGDVIGVRFPDGSLERHVVDQLTIPLDATSPMQITTRTPAPYLVITDVPIPLSPIPDGSFTPGADYGTVTDYGTPLDPPAYDTTPPGLYDGFDTPPLDTTPIPLDPFDTGSGTEPPPDWYGDGHKVLGAMGPGAFTDTSFHFRDYNTGDNLTATIGPLTFTDIGGTPAQRKYSVTVATSGSNTPVWYVTWGYQDTGSVWHDTDGSSAWVHDAGSNYHNLVTWTVLESALPIAVRFKNNNLIGRGDVDFLETASTNTNEVFYLHYIPMTTPDVIVKLDGTTLNPADNKYGIDYDTGLFTILPTMGATAGQVVTVQYKSDGTPSTP
jgi:hypothetical protein